MKQWCTNITKDTGFTHQQTKTLIGLHKYSIQWGKPHHVHITTTSFPLPMLEQIDALLCIITSCFPQLSTLRVTQYEHPHPYMYKYSSYHRVRGLRVRPFSMTPHVGSCTLSSEDHHRLTMYNNSYTM